MQLAVISDIHGNLFALDAILTDIQALHIEAFLSFTHHSAMPHAEWAVSKE